MNKLKFKPRAILELQNFILNYEEAFFDLYKDTGILSEDLIIQTYRESAEKIYLQILDEIEHRLSVKRVLGYKSIGKLFEINFHVDLRLIIILYTEDSKRKERLIESISIDRKPIIF